MFIGMQSRCNVITNSIKVKEMFGGGKQEFKHVINLFSVNIWKETEQSAKYTTLMDGIVFWVFFTIVA